MTQPNVWKVAPVKEQPSLTLVHWSILEIEAGTRHLSGYCLENREGRASTAIVKFDPATMRCDTQSGRVYQLQGGPEIPHGSNLATREEKRTVAGDARAANAPLFHLRAGRASFQL